MKYVGQERLIQDLKATNARAILIQGPSHFGKKTLIRTLFSELGLYVYEVTGTVNDFRETLDFIKTQTNPIMYLIPDVDQLHPGIQNLLLKILEEPPMKARFCLTANNSILPTIKSRCVCYSMQPYTESEICALAADSELALFNRSDARVQSSIKSPGQLELLYGWGHGEAVLSVIEQMTEIERCLGQSLALVLNKANLLAKYMREQELNFFTFYFLAKGLYQDSQSYQILSQRLGELDRYIMCYFYAELWKERACS